MIIIVCIKRIVVVLLYCTSLTTLWQEILVYSGVDYYFFGNARKQATSPFSTTIVSGGSPSLRTPVVVTTMSMLQMGLLLCTLVTLPHALIVSPTLTGAVYFKFCCMNTDPGPGSLTATKAFNAPACMPPCVMSDLNTVDSAYSLSKWRGLRSPVMLA